MQRNPEDSIDERLKLILRTWDVGNPSTTLDERVNASANELQNTLLGKDQPLSPPSLEDRMKSSYCQEICHPYPGFSRPLYWIWRFVAIAIIGMAVLYAAMRVGPTLIKGLRRDSGTIFNQQQQSPRTPNSPRGASSVLMNPGERKTTAGSSQYNSPDLPVRASTLPGGMISSQIGPGIGNPSYVPIEEIPPEEPASGSEYILSGTVTSVQGAPLPGATVSLHSSFPMGIPLQWPPAAASQVCDSDGRFTVRLRSPISPAVVHVENEGFAAVEEPVSLGKPGTLVKNYQLPAAVTCASGTVYAGENKALAGAMVMLGVVMSGSMKPSVSAVSSMTDDSGRYMLPGLPAEALGGRMHLRTYAHGFITEYSPLDLQPGPCKQVDIHLNPANLISFVVKNRQGSVIPNPKGSLLASGVASNLMISSGVSPGMLEWTVTQDAVPVTCTVSAGGYMPLTFTLDPKSPPAEVILEAGETLRGRVVSENGSPVRGAQISASGTRKDGSTGPAVEKTVETDADGKFVLPLSYPPVSRIRITKQGYAEQMIVYNMQPAPPVMQIQLQSAEAGLFGKVWNSDNQPAKWFSVSFYNPDDMKPIGFSRHCQDGSFSIRDIAPGTYLVRISVEPEGVDDLPKGDPFVLPRIDIRRGYMYGPLAIHLQPYVKK